MAVGLGCRVLILLNDFLGGDAAVGVSGHFNGDAGGGCCEFCSHTIEVALADGDFGDSNFRSGSDDVFVQVERIHYIGGTLLSGVGKHFALTGLSRSRHLFYDSFELIHIAIGEIILLVIL